MSLIGLAMAYPMSGAPGVHTPIGETQLWLLALLGVVILLVAKMRGR